MNRNLPWRLIGLCLIFLPLALLGQRTFTIKVNPAAPGRKLVELPPVNRPAALVQPTRNALDGTNFRRTAIPFQAFALVNPRTGKALDPNAQLTLPMPDGTKRTTTVKQYFEQLNAMEQAMASRGRSLRQSAAFADLKPNFATTSFKQSALPANFEAIALADFERTKSAATAPALTKINPVPSKAPTTIGLSPGSLKLADWAATAYIGESTSNLGTTEFPVNWVKVAIPSLGRKVFPVLVVVPKGFTPTVTKLEWQLSAQPFDENNPDFVPPLVRTGVVNAPNWSGGVRGGDLLLSQHPNASFSTFSVDFGAIAPEPVDDIKIYHLRVILYDQSGQPFKRTNGLVVPYGAKKQVIKITYPRQSSVPGFSYAFPESAQAPFGVFVRGQGLEAIQWQETTNSGGASTTLNLGFQASASATLGVKYYNFLNLIDGNEPVNRELEIIRGSFSAQVGKTSAQGAAMTPGGKLALSILGMKAEEINFSPDLPGGGFSLNYDVAQGLEMGLVDLRFFIGPVPVRIAAGLSGQAGVHLYGQLNPTTQQVSATLNPYLNTAFKATGGVDAVIAWATVNAEVNPLVGADLLLGINSSSNPPVALSSGLQGLKGRVFLSVGFYYPCPPVQQVKKLVGFVTGGEDLPLCECVWEYNIFQFDGFQYAYKY